MNAKTDNSIHQYLNEIDSGPLLTRKEEGDLIRNIEVYQKQIIDGFLKSRYAKGELFSYLLSLSNSGVSVVDISKKLDDESDPKLVKSIEVAFADLLKKLADGTNDEIQALLNEVSISGNIIHGIVTEIKKRHTKIVDVEDKVKNIQKWFPNRSFDNTMELISKIRSNEQIRTELRKELRLTELQMMNKCGEWENGIKEFKEFQTTLPEGVTLVDMKTSYKEINTLEFQMRKFKTQLIERNLRLVVARAKRFMNRGLEFEDLIQEGNIGLIKAVDKYDISKKTKVATYATWWIDQSIRRAISNKGKTVRIPTHIEFLQSNLSQLIHKMTGDLKRTPTLKEISAESKIDLDTLEKLQTRALHEIGLEEGLSSGLSLMEVLPSDPSKSPFNLTEEKIMKETIREILATLSPRNEKIIRLRYGIGDIPKELQTMNPEDEDDGLTLQVIGDHIGITKQGIRQVEISSLKKMKKKMEKMTDGF